MIHRSALVNGRFSAPPTDDPQPAAWKAAVVALAAAGSIVAFGANLPWIVAGPQGTLLGALDLRMWPVYVLLVAGGIALIAGAIRRWRHMPLVALLVAAASAGTAAWVGSNLRSALSQAGPIHGDPNWGFHAGIGLGVLLAGAAAAVAGAVLTRAERTSWTWASGRRLPRGESFMVGNVVWLSEGSRRRARSIEPDWRQAAFLVHLAAFTAVAAVSTVAYIEFHPAFPVGLWWPVAGWAVAVGAQGLRTWRDRALVPEDRSEPAPRRRHAAAVQIPASTSRKRPSTASTRGNVVALRPRASRR